MVLAEDRVRNLELLGLGITREEAAVEPVQRPAPEGFALVHCMEEPQQVLPDGRGVRGIVWVVAPLDEEIAQELRWEGERLTHVLAEEDEDATIEDLLCQPDEAPSRAGKAGGPFRVLLEKSAVEPLAERAIFRVELVLQLAVFEPLLGDEIEQQAPAALREQRVAMKHLLEEETVEPRLLCGAEQSRPLKKVTRLDREAQRLLVAAIVPVEPELVHIGDDPPGREDRLGTDHAAPREAQVIEALPDRRSRIALALLIGIEGTANILELAEHLRNSVGCTFAEIADREIGFAFSSVGSRAGDRKFRVERKPAFRSLLPALHIPPHVSRKKMSMKAPSADVSFKAERLTMRQGERPAHSPLPSLARRGSPDPNGSAKKLLK
jgi:hypothetical protein